MHSYPTRRVLQSCPAIEEDRVVAAVSAALCSDGKKPPGRRPLQFQIALKSAFAHLLEAVGEGISWKHAGRRGIPHPRRGIDVAAIAGVVHGSQDGLEAGLLCARIHELVGPRAQEAN